MKEIRKRIVLSPSAIKRKKKCNKFAYYTDIAGWSKNQESGKAFKASIKDQTKNIISGFEYTENHKINNISFNEAYQQWYEKFNVRSKYIAHMYNKKYRNTAKTVKNLGVIKKFVEIPVINEKAKEKTIYEVFLTGQLEAYDFTRVYKILMEKNMSKSEWYSSKMKSYKSLNTAIYNLITGKPIQFNGVFNLEDHGLSKAKNLASARKTDEKNAKESIMLAVQNEYMYYDFDYNDLQKSKIKALMEIHDYIHMLKKGLFSENEDSCKDKYGYDCSMKEICYFNTDENYHRKNESYCTLQNINNMEIFEQYKYIEEVIEIEIADSKEIVDSSIKDFAEEVKPVSIEDTADTLEADAKDNKEFIEVYFEGLADEDNDDLQKNWNIVLKQLQEFRDKGVIFTTKQENIINKARIRAFNYQLDYVCRILNEKLLTYLDNPSEVWVKEANNDISNYAPLEFHKDLFTDQAKEKIEVFKYIEYIYEHGIRSKLAKTKKDCFNIIICKLLEV